MHSSNFTPTLYNFTKDRSQHQKTILFFFLFARDDIVDFIWQIQKNINGTHFKGALLSRYLATLQKARRCLRIS